MQLLKGLASMYSPSYPRALITLLDKKEGRPGRYFHAYWRTTSFHSLGREKIRPARRGLLILLALGMFVQLAIGTSLIYHGATDDLTGGIQFGLAAIVAMPVVWALLLPLLAGLWALRNPKKVGRAIVCSILESQVRRLRKRHSFQVVAVAGSMGKTSTKIAIAQLLGVSRRVQWQEGNYNDRVTVPLIFFGHNQPNILNVFAWLRIFLKNERMISGSYPYNVVVAELGTDGPGFIKEFAYVKPDVAVVAAISPEHMEYFGTLQAVANEELSILNYSQQSLVNIDDTPVEYLEGRDFTSYGLSAKATYYASGRKNKGLHGQNVTFYIAKDFKIKLDIPLLGEQGAKAATAAAATAHLLGVSRQDIEQGLAAVSSFAGRMQVLPGISDSTLIDDTYNAAPLTVKAALDVLYTGKAPQRIAILGSINEMGDYAPDAHREVGEYCDPSKLDWVVTIGQDAKDYLAPVAKERGCQVKTFLDPHAAGKFVKKQLKDGAVVLAKGSQNRVFAEESLKPLLADPADQQKLVRQSAYWMRIKRKQFPS